jgi:hypothetical protein
MISSFIASKSMRLKPVKLNDVIRSMRINNVLLVIQRGLTWFQEDLND